MRARGAVNKRRPSAAPRCPYSAALRRAGKIEATSAQRQQRNWAALAPQQRAAGLGSPLRFGASGSSPTRAGRKGQEEESRPSAPATPSLGPRRGHDPSHAGEHAHGPGMNSLRPRGRGGGVSPPRQAARGTVRPQPTWWHRQERTAREQAKVAHRHTGGRSGCVPAEPYPPPVRVHTTRNHFGRASTSAPPGAGGSTHWPPSGKSRRAQRGVVPKFTSAGSSDASG